MKTLVLAFVLGMAALALQAAGGARRFAVEDAAAVRALFERFEREHGRRYADPRERRAKLAIFTDNLARVNQLNEENPYAEYGITKYMDKNIEELMPPCIGMNHRLTHNDMLPKCENITKVPEIHVPDSFDWREHWVVTQAKSQGYCGCCWAFGVIGNVESQFAIKYKKLVTFSEQQLVSCDKYDKACSGGEYITALPALIEMGGIETDEDYPYVSENRTVPECKMDKSKFKAKVVGCKQFLHKNVTEDDLVHHLVSNGPLAIGVWGAPLWLYKKGVITDCHNDTNVGHAALLVGYGRTDDGVPYWIGKNSLGPEMDDNGFFKMLRGINCLNFLSYDIMSSVVA